MFELPNAGQAHRLRALSGWFIDAALPASPMAELGRLDLGAARPKAVAYIRIHACDRT